MQKLLRSDVLPVFLRTGLRIAAFSVVLTVVFLPGLLHLPTAWLYVLPGLVCLVFSVTIGFWRLYRFARQARLNNLSPAGFFSQGLFLFLVVMLLLLSLDGLWYLVDPEPAHHYAAALAQATLPGQTGQEPAFPLQFGQFPIFVQALFPVLAGTAIGCMLAAFLARQYAG